MAEQASGEAVGQAERTTMMRQVQLPQCDSSAYFLHVHTKEVQGGPAYYFQALMIPSWLHDSSSLSLTCAAARGKVSELTRM